MAVDLGTVVDGGHGVRRDGALREHEPGIGLVDPDQAVRQPESGEPVANRRRLQQFERDAMLVAGREGTLDQDRIGSSGVDAAGRDEQTFADACTKLVPALIGAPNQRHVPWILVVREADDAGDATRRSGLGGHARAFQAQHSLAPRCQLGDGGAAHGAHAGHDDVV